MLEPHHIVKPWDLDRAVCGVDVSLVPVCERDCTALVCVVCADLDRVYSR